MSYMRKYQDASEQMNNEAVEYVRGIPVVKVFQQTIYSFKSFYAAIMYYKDNVTEYALSCQGPMVAFNVIKMCIRDSLGTVHLAQREGVRGHGGHRTEEAVR